MDKIQSLEKALEGHWATAFGRLPKDLRQRVDHTFRPIHWRLLTPYQRQYYAQHWDALHNPKLKPLLDFMCDWIQRRNSIQVEIDRWRGAATPTANDAAIREGRLNELERELAILDIRCDQAIKDALTGPINFSNSGENDAAGLSDFLPYPKAMRILVQNHGASPEEVAAWIFYGPDPGRLNAYLNVSEIQPPIRFHFEWALGDDFDYVGPLMACWFRASDISTFVPAERYITGQALLKRWSVCPGIKAEPYIRAKIKESRLLDMHPITGGTQWRGDATRPAKESAIFSLSRVLAIEEEDGLDIAATATHAEDADDEIDSAEESSVTSTVAGAPKFAASIGGETPAERAMRLKAAYDIECSRGPRGALKRLALKEGITRQTLEKILKRAAAKVLPISGDIFRKHR